MKWQNEAKYTWHSRSTEGCTCVCLDISAPMSVPKNISILSEVKTVR